MGIKHIATTERIGLAVAQVGGNDVYRMRPQLQNIIELGAVGDDYAGLFAEPVEGGRTIDWYAEDGENVVRVLDLPLEAQQPLLCRFRDMLGTLQNYAIRLRVEGKSLSYRSYADILEKALVVPDLNCLYAVDGKPVLICWGFSAGDSDIVDETRKLIRQIERQIDKGRVDRQEPPVSAAMPSATPAAPASPSGTSEEPKPAPVRAAAEQGDRQPARKKSSSRFIWLLLLLLLLAALAAAWYFFGRDRGLVPTGPDTSMAFLKGDINARGILSNEGGERVDVRFTFPGEDGRGTGYVVERTQTCQGPINAMANPDSTVSFEVGELICPNRNHYEPFTLVCTRAHTTYSCTGRDGRGTPWQTEILLEGSPAQ